MKLGFIFTGSYENSLGVIIRTSELVKKLSQNGVEIHIISPFHYPNLDNYSNIYFHKLPNIFNSLTSSKYSLNFITSILNKRKFSPMVYRSSFLENIINYYSKAIFKLIKEIDLDILQGEQQIAALSCIKLKKLIEIPIVSNLHNIWVEELVDLGVIYKNEKSYNTLLQYEKLIVDKSNMVITLGSEMKSYYDNIADHHGNVIVVPISVNKKISNVEYIKMPSKIIYAGLLSKLDDAWLFLNSIPYVKKYCTYANIYMTNKGEEYTQIKRYSDVNSIDLNFFWFPEKEGFNKFLSKCDVGVVTSKNVFTRRIGYALKFFDYLSLGVPIVSNNIGGWTKIIEKEKVGILTDNDPKSFAQGLLYLLNNPDVRYEMSKNCLSLCDKKYNLDKIVIDLIKQYKCLLV